MPLLQKATQNGYFRKMKYVQTLLLIFIFGLARGQSNFSSEDLSYMYDPGAEITLDVEHFYSSGPKFSMYVHLVLRSGLYDIDSYEMYYALSNSYTRNIEEFVILDMEQHLVQNVRYN